VTKYHQRSDLECDIFCSDSVRSAWVVVLIWYQLGVNFSQFRHPTWQAQNLCKTNGDVKTKMKL